MGCCISICTLLLTAPGFVIAQSLLLEKNGSTAAKSERDIEFETVNNDLIARRNSGDMAAATYLGQNYIRWNRSEKDIETGLFYLEESAGYGFARAQVDLGHLYLNGEFVEVDLERARHLFIAAAQQGSAEALGVLAWMYITGRGVEKNQEIAATYLQRAAELGDRYSMENYASKLIWGPEESANKELGIFYLTELAEMNSNRAEYLFAQLHLDGTHLPYDPDMAETWLARAAEHGNTAAKILDLQLRYGKASSNEEKVLIRDEQREIVDGLQNNQKNGIAWIMSTHSYQPFQDGEFAVQVMEGMLSDGIELPIAHMDTLAAAYAASGNFDDAVKLQARAIARIEEDGGQAADQSFLDRLALYKNRKQYIQ